MKAAPSALGSGRHVPRKPATADWPVAASFTQSRREKEGPLKPNTQNTYLTTKSHEQSCLQLFSTGAGKTF